MKQEPVVWVATLLVCVAGVHLLADRGGPYFATPATVVDHVSRLGHDTRGALRLIPEAARLIPKDATVTAFRPKKGRAWDDHSSYLTAVGLLPYHRVLPPFTAYHETSPEALARYVLAIGEPFDHPRYEVIAGFPAGWLYRVRP
jgi:hypothetical protein